MREIKFRGKRTDNRNRKGVIDRESVELIALGYEWICPLCGRLNVEIEVTEKVKCKDKRCKKRYEVEEYHHATG